MAYAAAGALRTRDRRGPAAVRAARQEVTSGPRPGTCSRRSEGHRRAAAGRLHPEGIPARTGGAPDDRRRAPGPAQTLRRRASCRASSGSRWPASAASWPGKSLANRMRRAARRPGHGGISSRAVNLNRGEDHVYPAGYRRRCLAGYRGRALALGQPHSTPWLVCAACGGMTHGSSSTSVSSVPRLSASTRRSRALSRSLAGTSAERCDWACRSHCYKRPPEPAGDARPFDGDHQS